MPGAIWQDCGLPKERTYVTGSPWRRCCTKILPKSRTATIHARLGLEKGKYILLSAHREENIDTEKNFCKPVHGDQQDGGEVRYADPLLLPSAQQKAVGSVRLPARQARIQHEPLGFHDYNCLQMNAFCVVSDSGTLPEESSFSQAWAIRSRRCVSAPAPSARRRWTRDASSSQASTKRACFRQWTRAVEMNQNGDHGIPVPDYVEENVSTKVVKIIQSYTGVVNKMVWRKD